METGNSIAASGKSFHIITLAKVQRRRLFEIPVLWTDEETYLRTRHLQQDNTSTVEKTRIRGDFKRQGS